MAREIETLLDWQNYCFFREKSLQLRINSKEQDPRTHTSIHLYKWKRRLIEGKVQTFKTTFGNNIRIHQN